jgi:acetate CoA/acetoacetate CoA-transferase alpha subunit
MAMAGKCVIAESNEILPVGMISPDHVDTPGVVVDHLVAIKLSH